MTTEGFPRLVHDPGVALGRGEVGFLDIAHMSWHITDELYGPEAEDTERDEGERDDLDVRVQGAIERALGSVGHYVDNLAAVLERARRDDLAQADPRRRGPGVEPGKPPETLAPEPAGDLDQTGSQP